MRGPNLFKTERARGYGATQPMPSASFGTGLRSRAIGRHKFVRQEPVGPYIADFVCRESRLIIEVDGGQHATDPRDPLRDRWLTDHGYRILRFWNNDVLDNTDGVLEVIATALENS